MSKISAMMDIGKRSLANSQTKIQTVAHNIANKSTEGYSRQRVDQVSNEPIGTGRLRMGMGAKAAQVSRITNPYLEKQIATEGSKLGFLQQKDEVMGQVEQVFNEQQNKGLNHYISEFFNSFRALAANPESVANRTLIRENAIALTNDFRRVRSQLTDIQRDVDQRLSEQVSEINDYSKEVAKLNEKIQMVEMQGVPANDERDRRDLLIKKISEKVNIKASEGRDGQVAITAGNSALLVSGYSHMDLGVSARPEEGIRREGNFDIVHHPSPDSEEFVVTNQISGGAMGGLLHIRDVVVNDLLDQVDAMAYSLVKEVNQAHIQGYDRHSGTGVQFFGDLAQIRDASQFIDLSEAIKRDVGKIATGAIANAPGDNRVANVIANIQNQKSFNRNEDTIDDFYRSMVGQVGVLARTSRMSHEAQRDIHAQLANIRESVSGVSLDEETTKMIEFQKTYDASARLIRTADEMFDTVLSLKR